MSPELNLCQILKPILTLSRVFSVFPAIECTKIKNHNNDLICDLKLSKFWMTISIINQIIFIPFVLLTTYHSIHAKFEANEILWFANMVHIFLHEVELYTILIFGLANTKRMCIILTELSTIPNCPDESKHVARNIRVITIILMIMFLIMSSTYLGAIWLKKDTICVISFSNILESTIGFLIRNYLLIFTQIQCLYIVMLSSIFSIKYEYLALNVTILLDKCSKFNHVVEKRNVIHIKPNGGIALDKNSKVDTSTYSISDNLSLINSQFNKITNCLSEINNCTGFQVLVTLTTDLYTLIFFIFRGINIHKYNMSVFLAVNSIIGSILLSTKLILYMWAGHNIKTKSRKPLETLQRGNLIKLPQQIQQQIQTILLQWSIVGTGSLSAFHLMDVGPWLLAPIVGNVITYLLVFIQNG